MRNELKLSPPTALILYSSVTYGKRNLKGTSESPEPLHVASYNNAPHPDNPSDPTLPLRIVTFSQGFCALSYLNLRGLSEPLVPRTPDSTFHVSHLPNILQLHPSTTPSLSTRPFVPHAGTILALCCISRWSLCLCLGDFVGVVPSTWKAFLLTLIRLSFLTFRSQSKHHLHSGPKIISWPSFVTHPLSIICILVLLSDMLLGFIFWLPN